MVCAPVYNSARWLPRNQATIDNLDYPKDALTYSYLDGGSTDGTLQLLTQWLSQKQHWTIRRIVYPETWIPTRKMWESVNQLFKLLQNEEYVFLADSDVIHIPPETLKVLISKNVDMIHPYIYIEDTPDEGNKWAGFHQFYDTWAFRFQGVPWTNTYETAVEMKPKANPDTGLIPMDSVGGNPVLIRREVVEEVEYHGENAIVGFCAQARKFGFKIYSIPAIECVHAWESI